MLRRSLFAASVLLLATALLPAESWGRGFGGARGGGGGFRGGGFSGGGMRGGGFSGGGFSGGGGMRSGGMNAGAMRGGGMSAGNFGGGNLGGGNFGGGRPGGEFGGGNLGGAGQRPGGNFGGEGFGGGNLAGGFNDGGFNRGGLGAGAAGAAGLGAGALGAGAFGGGREGFGEGAGGFGAGGERNFGAGNFGEGGFGGARGAAPSRNELGNFLGLPSDEGFHSASGSRTGPGGNVDFNYGAATGPRGGAIGGATATGPEGNTVGRAGAVGPDGGVARARGFEGAGGASGVQGAAIGPGGRFAAGSAVRGPEGGAAARGVVGGPGGVAGGFARVSPSGRYVTAGGVRRGYDNWGVYGRGWYADHPGAWYAAGWTAGYAWNWATWDSLGSWMSYYPAQPVYYDYGTNVVYQGDNVYVNDQSVGTAEQYYDQAAQIASSGASAEDSSGTTAEDTAAAPSDGSAANGEEWLPLGVFAMTKPDEASGNLTLQLAVNKQGIIRGNYTDSTSGTTEVVQGAVDKQTQRVAFTIGDNKDDVVETGIYNLTKDEAPVLIHFGKDRTEQWLLVRLKQPESDGGQSAGDAPAGEN